jgi:DNA-binding transcriptional MerR regulator
MFSIGDFARHGRVSVRMLRHYDVIGLLRPAFVDQTTGYRSYQADQLARLNRIVALKDLGFTLERVATILDERISADELWGMLRLRHAELAAQIEADTARLRQVEARLQAIQREGQMPTTDVQIKDLPGVRVAELTGVAGSYGPDDITPVIRPLYADLASRLERANVPVTGPAIAYYEHTEDGRVVVHAGLTVASGQTGGHDFAVIDLPVVPLAATVVHYGSMDGVMASYETLALWIEANGHTIAGPAQELYLDADPDRCEAWIVELRQPLVPA